jgi:hypothetical protein
MLKLLCYYSTHILTPIFMTQLAFFEVGILSTFKQYDHNFNPFPFNDLHKLTKILQVHVTRFEVYFFSKEIYYYKW